MKGLYKKISAIVLAGMVVLGGGALAGVQKVDAVSWVDINHQLGIRGVGEVRDFGVKYGFRIVEYGSKDKIDKHIKEKIKKESLRKRLLKSEGNFIEKDKLESHLKELKKGKVKMHRFSYKGLDYIILFK